MKIRKTPYELLSESERKLYDIIKSKLENEAKIETTRVYYYPYRRITFSPSSSSDMDGLFYIRQFKFDRDFSCLPPSSCRPNKTGYYIWVKGSGGSSLWVNDEDEINDTFDRVYRELSEEQALKEIEIVISAFEGER